MPDRVKYLHVPVRWLCPVCRKASTTEYGSESLMYEALLEHLKDSHSMEADDPICRAAARDCAARFRSVGTCPICGTCYEPSTRSGAAKLETAAREKVEDCIANHLESLALFFSSRTLSYLMLSASTERTFSNTSHSSCREQMAPLEFPMQFQDPPIRPPPDAVSGSQCGPSDDEEQDCLAANESQVLADWGDNSWFLKRRIYESEKLDSVDSIANDRDEEWNWAPLGSVGALLHATYGLLLLHICAEMVSESGSVSTRKELNKGENLYHSLNRLKLAVKQMIDDSKKVGDDGGGFQVRSHPLLFCS